MLRNYTQLIDAASWARPMTKDDAMKLAVDLLWKAFGNKPISWVGFYIKVADADEMVLVCREPKPACSPIGLHGMCGRSYLTKQSIVVADVRTLGANYIACDPKDMSEVVIPMVDQDGTCRGVLDVDSHELGAFSELDVKPMNRLLQALRLTRGLSPITRL